ncbi:MAG: prenyltransferase [Coriobacteriales bacterium]|jgi:1,4-dihydroxy-2-naphthoate octaprenyltransferase|nr:prenyltransferase [Coriobacteriales bacterium]
MVGLLAGKTFKFWYAAARPASLGQSLTPYVLGAVLALGSLLYQGTWSLAFGYGAQGLLSVQGVALGLLLAVAGLIGVACAHLGLNLLDDYFDYRGGAVARRKELQEGGMRARMGKCAYLDQGATLGDTRRVAIMFIAVALVSGGFILAIRGWEVLIFAGCALVLGLAYAGPPLRLSYHGLGEVVIGVIFGPLVVIASYFVICGHIDSVAVWASIPTGLLALNIVHTHAIMDFGPDKAAKRTTLAVLLGSPKTAALFGAIFIGLAYGTVITGVALGFLPVLSLLVLLTIPMAVELVRLVLRYADDPASTFSYRRWMGPMEHWDAIVARGVDWFMIRWYLSRNLLMAFVVILAVAGLTPFYVS